MRPNIVIKENIDAIVDEYIAYLNSQEFLDDNYPGQNLKITDKMDNGVLDPNIGLNSLGRKKSPGRYPDMKQRILDLRKS